MPTQHYPLDPRCDPIGSRKILNEKIIYKKLKFSFFIVSDFRMMFNLEDDIKFMKI